MTKLLIGVGFAALVIQIAAFAPAAQAKRRTVFEPHSGYCQSLVHVRNTRFCKERGGRW